MGDKPYREHPDYMHRVENRRVPSEEFRREWQRVRFAFLEHIADAQTWNDVMATCEALSAVDRHARSRLDELRRFDPRPHPEEMCAGTGPTTPTADQGNCSAPPNGSDQGRGRDGG